MRYCTCGHSEHKHTVGGQCLVRRCDCWEFREDARLTRRDGQRQIEKLMLLEQR